MNEQMHDGLMNVPTVQRDKHAEEHNASACQSGLKEAQEVL